MDDGRVTKEGKKKDDCNNLQGNLDEFQSYSDV